MIVESYAHLEVHLFPQMLVQVTAMTKVRTVLYEWNVSCIIPDYPYASLQGNDEIFHPSTPLGV